MKLKLIYLLLLIVLFLVLYVLRNQIIGLFFSSEEKQTIESIVEKYNPKVKASLQNNFAKNNIDSTDFEMGILAFKKEQILELYIRKNETDNWKMLKKYPFTAFSGKIGPKLKNGDKQIPEGIYQMEYLNPNSKYHLSIKVNYPNTFDEEKAKLDGRTDLGGDIMIHGKSVTIGCIPVGDKNIEEIFILATKTKNKHFPIIIAPQDFRTNKTFPEIEAISWEKDLYENIAKELTNFE
ncbi:L,D-transpeptidase family protein [Flavobacterium macrobrachii]|uniref:L,D-transpeptidase family protein n=1 Tax=Flavobacterium macrobrachii TaxID=591204 RepID=A0ABS2CZQ1_9FLAO|nr:L,D-transpeptidase family protein [Flavobacterium macrobrachii]MBM6500054.1 L,D-transpeptidase family protein [Flavobacterium macrobrachii]